jgi:hypothetical protein
MERTLRTQVPQLPPNTQFGWILVNLTLDLAIVSPTLMLQICIPHLRREPRAVIRGIIPNPAVTPGTEMNCDTNAVEVLDALTSIISLESSLLYLSFLARYGIIMVIEVHQHVLAFRLSTNLIPHRMVQENAYHVVLNPQTRESLETFYDYRRH